MAIFKSVLMSSATGSLGNITLTTQKGRVIAKEKASIVANPRTEEQVKQRNALAQSVFIWKKVGGYVKSGITSFGKYSNPYAGFISTNIKEIKANPKDVENYKNKMLQGLSATQGQFNEIVTEKPTLTGVNLSTKINLSIIKEEAKKGFKIKVLVGGVNQSDFHLETKVYDDVSAIPNSEDISIHLPSKYQGQSIVTAVWYESADGKTSSTSVFR